MKTYSLGSIICKHGGLIQTGPFGSQLHQHDYSQKGVPVVMPKDIRNGRIDENTVARIPEQKAHELSRHFLKQGSIVYPRRGEISKCAYIDADQEGFLCGTGCIKIELPGEVISSRFLFYYLGLRHVVEWLERNAVGTTMLNLNTSIIGGIQIPDIDIGRQNKIADILSAYDDLIENNRRRIALLEQAARLLYKEWFVHLRFPGHEHIKITDGVPEGWRLGIVSDFFSTASGGTPSRKNPSYYEGGINWVKTQELLDGFIFSTEEKITEEALNRSAAKIFPAETVLIAMYGATIGQTGILAVPSASNQACCAVVPIGADTTTEYAYLFFRENKDTLKNLSQGAAQNNISQQIIKNFPMLMPSRDIMDPFALYSRPMLKQMKVLQAANTLITKARDLLLPRLMNGEIVVE